MRALWDRFVRTPFLGWVQREKSEAERYAEATLRADRARAFLDNDIVVEAYQGMLDKITDELLNATDPQKVLALHSRAQALMGLILQMKVFMNEVEILDAEREKREKRNPKPDTDA